MAKPDPDPYKRSNEWENNVGEKERRKLRARSEKGRSIWFGLGAFGVVGWTIVVPSLLGVFIGMWIDRNWQSGYSFTLILFFSGLLLGCYNAWRWIFHESGIIDPEKEKKKTDES